MALTSDTSTKEINITMTSDNLKDDSFIKRTLVTTKMDVLFQISENSDSSLDELTNTHCPEVFKYDDLVTKYSLSVPDVKPKAKLKLKPKKPKKELKKKKTPAVEDKPETAVVEDKPETAVVEDKTETAAVEAKPETPVVEDKPETPVVEDKPETTVVEDKPETPVVEDKPETPVVDPIIVKNKPKTKKKLTKKTKTKKTNESA